MQVFKWLLLAPIGALLAGCAPDHKVVATLKDQVTVTGTSCSFPRLAQLKMEKIDGGWTIPARINDYNVRLTVDTGASDILISRAAAVAMELPVDEDRRIETFIGFGGASSAKPVKTRHFVVGGFDIRDESAAVAPFKTNYQVSPPVVGLLGLSYLAAFDVEIDFARQTLSLYGSNHCGHGFLPWQGPYETLPLKNKFDDYARVDLTVDGHPLEAVLDTGAENLAASQFGAWEAGLSNEQILNGRQYTAITPDGKNPYSTRLRSMKSRLAISF